MEENGCVQQLDLAEISTMSMLKLKNDVKSASRLRMYVSAQEMNIFKMRRAGPLSTWAPGPARRILKMFISKKTKEGGDPMEAIHFTPISSFMGSPGLGTITIRSALKS